MTTLYDSQGKPVSLGPELGRGGEGSVFEVAGQAQLAAKVYHKAANADRSAKILAMVQLGNERLRQLAAWPLDSLHVKPHGPVVGLIMARLTGYKPIHQLYGPKTRLAEFPSAQWPFLVYTAANVARAFAAMHEQSHVIGDVNHNNIVVSDKATVKFIDCDSFQIADNGRVFICPVGVPTHTPPELQGVSLASVVRHSNHDNFGLAILVFQLLFLARHPFSGNYLGSGDMPIERAIREHRFAYGLGAPSRQMKQPPASLSLDDVSPPVASLFERAFSPQGSRDGSRPTAREWVGALEQLGHQLRQCNRNASHSFLSSLSSCPWCEIEMRAGTLLFNIVVTRTWQSQSTFDLTVAWAQISAVRSPGPSPSLPDTKSVVVRPSGKGHSFRKKRRIRFIAAVSLVTSTVSLVLVAPLTTETRFWILAGVIGAALLTVRTGSKASRDEAKHVRDAALKRLDAIKVRWYRESGETAFKQELDDLTRKRQQYVDLPAEHQKRLNELRANRRQYQLRRFLERHRLATTSITNFGPSRKATLQSYGIETAADISESSIRAIPGFGATLASNLVAWRRSIERSFVFDPAKGVDQRDIATIETDIGAIRNRLEQSLLGGAGRLTQIAQQTELKRASIRSEAQQAIRELAQAEADLKEFGRW